MLLKINFESDIPIYIQLENQIIEGIARNELKPGDSLPSVRQLAEDIGINMHTVNKAYNLLKNDGFIKIDRRKGAIINTTGNSINAEYIAKLKEQMTPIIAEAHCRGMTADEFFKVCSEVYKIYGRNEM